ncbi:MULTISPECIES: oxidoreductase [Rhizobium]|uniref:Short chain dehydrogenase n=1 Tax=Rhizobium tropici TaxID=398 RepID=A0A329YIS1_RHITR|nr:MULTISPECIES: oxidoreductase [Rhizobium]MBB3290472.1 NAD(P)-dependent dehydrogenase (short-subunit alcohol dehydrogenase family) [Rhizobium sp. BK252]MBB3405210.1 NAD(P)-dependent dehydrogenase (short-subunit alcohol dehydrogenase family) [Rhizobium sp. BK289]MBB3417799.1 NAD(P)-dependent dehydrogenase (short-subunit alcohol dehydrogenase family) [Rhizobium sp. BK284]MBB3485678.1 NAD(P)-dependent dehydrogenase (short-subunit alcohol dehydrogenase family) [Rhizobium sp. BK347]MDK4717940.1 ox
MPQPWTLNDMPSQKSRTILITGTGGLAFEDAVAMAEAGGDVIIAGRNPTKGAEAVRRIKERAPQSSVTLEIVDLASLASIEALAKRLKETRDHIDVLINNAGVMTPPTRQTTKDGFELQFGTNYLGHFALTGQLLPLLMRAQYPRVVTLSSIAVRSASAAINFDDLQAERGYKPMPVYTQSKLACLMFAFELQRRSEEAGWRVTSIAAHPGVSRTDLLHNAPGRHSAQGLLRTFLWFLFQPVAQGALPTLFAATSSDARGGGYYGPDRLSETRGHPTEAQIPRQAMEKHVAHRLWEISEKLTGISFSAQVPLPERSSLDETTIRREG